MNPVILKLLRWYRAHGRDLPWRQLENSSLSSRTYHVLISEFMLQQTQVQRVIPKYHEWLKQFPSWQSLANAKTTDLIHAWAGLGYNRRALALREIARHVIANGIPKNQEAWQELKGIGPYTAAALNEFALHQRAIVIDTNVRRVAGRVFLGKPYPPLELDPLIRRLLEKLTPKNGRHWDLPQAFMDLGSLLCTFSNPHCSTCPLQKECKAAKLFLSTKSLPRPRPTKSERRYRNKKYPDRIYRGRILQLIRLHGPQLLSSIGPEVDRTFHYKQDAAWLQAMILRLAKDGLLAVSKSDIVSLPYS